MRGSTVKGRAEEIFVARHGPASVARIEERKQPGSRMREFVRISRVRVIHRCPMHFGMIVRDRIVAVAHHHCPRVRAHSHRR